MIVPPNWFFFMFMKNHAARYVVTFRREEDGITVEAESSDPTDAYTQAANKAWSMENAEG